MQNQTHTHTQPLPRAGQWIEITLRRQTATAASPLLQPGARLAVKATTQTGGGIPVVEVMHPKKKNATLRVNTRDFAFKAFTLDELRQEKFKKAMAEETRGIVTQFTKTEQVQIAFVPLVWTLLAFHFAEEAAGFAASYRIEVLKKVTRAVRKLRADFDAATAKDLDYSHRRDLEGQSLRFLEEHRRDFTILDFTIQRELLRLYPSYDYMDMRAAAVTAMLLIDLTDRHNREMDALMQGRLRHGVTEAVRMPVMDALYSCMDAMTGEIPRFRPDTRDIQMAVQVIRNGMACAEFDII